MNSGDGGSELTQAVHFCATGHIASSKPLGEGFRNYTGARTWYDASDLGGTLLMLPGACAAAARGVDDVNQYNLPTIAKAGSSLTYALVGGLGVAFIFLALSEMLPLRRSWWWSLAFLFGTGFLAYTKATWSMLPAATAVAAVCWLAIRSSMGMDNPRKTVLLTAAAVGAAGLARYSFLPFFALGASAAVFPAIKRLKPAELALCAAVLVAITVPDFAYNALRTGEFWKPAQSAPGHHLTSSYLLGTPGLFFGVQRGLLFFAPFCFLGYFAAAYFGFASGGERRWRWLVGLAAAVGYAVFVCLVQDWDKFGWGPRYLVPLLPALFVVAVRFSELLPRVRPLSYLLVSLGLITQIPLAISNWNALAAVVGHDSRAPNQIVGLWNSAIDGMVDGRGFGKAADSRILQVPDTWWWHATAGHIPHQIGLLLLLSVLAGTAFVGARITGGGALPGARPDPPSLEPIG